MTKLVGALDQGTSSTRFILFDEGAQQVAVHQMEHEQIYPQDGWCEHNPTEIIENSIACIDGAVAAAVAKGYKASDVASIGITNQRETTLVWSRATGKPFYNAIVWLDLRTAAIAEELKADGGEDRFRAACGLPISTYFSGVKLRWMMKNVPAVAEAVASGDAMFGTVDSWLVYHLSGGATGGGVHITDVTNASRTMLMNLQTLSWDAATCAAFGVPLGILPEIKSSAEVYANLARSVLKGVPIAGVLGDQHAAMLGQCAMRPGEAKNTYGTGCFMLMNVGEKVVSSTHGLLSTVCFKLGKDAPAIYALEGSVAVAGRAVQWLRDSLGIINSAPEVEALAKSVGESAGVTFVPAFTGLFAPYWRSDARGCIFGMTLYTTKAHIAYATLEAVAFQVREVLDAMEADSGIKLALLKVDGGMTLNRLLLQLQANTNQVPVVVPSEVETTALGAAFAAGLAVGVWASIDALKHVNPAAKQYTPISDAADANAKLARWKGRVQRTLNLAATGAAAAEEGAEKNESVAGTSGVAAAVPALLPFVGLFLFTLLLK